MSLCILSVVQPACCAPCRTVPHIRHACMQVVAPAGALRYEYTLRTLPAFDEIQLRHSPACAPFELRAETADEQCWKAMAAKDAGV